MECLRDTQRRRRLLERTDLFGFVNVIDQSWCAQLNGLCVAKEVVVCPATDVISALTSASCVGEWSTCAAHWALLQCAHELAMPVGDQVLDGPHDLVMRERVEAVVCELLERSCLTPAMADALRGHAPRCYLVNYVLRTTMMQTQSTSPRLLRVMLTWLDSLRWGYLGDLRGLVRLATRQLAPTMVVRAMQVLCALDCTQRTSPRAQELLNQARRCGGHMPINIGLMYRTAYIKPVIVDKRQIAHVHLVDDARFSVREFVSDEYNGRTMLEISAK